MRSLRRSCYARHAMLEMLNRVCWNTSGWRLPTYASADGGYVNRTGFGIEEWNFQTDDAVSGYVFGYLKYGPSEDTIAMADGHFKIGFWSIQPDSKERLLVGIYHDATLATEADHVTLSEEFTRRGVLERRINETLLAIPRSGLSVIKEELERTIPTAYNFKCPAAQVEVLDVPRSLPSQFGAKRLGLRFTNSTFVPLGTLTELTVSKRRQAPSAGHSFPQWQDGYYREVGASLRYIEGLHSQLAAGFGLWLQQNGFHEVIWEKSRVDIEFLSADLLFVLRSRYATR